MLISRSDIKAKVICQAERGVHVFCLAFLVYLLTVAPGATLWDACEFVCCGSRLDVGHPPGAPLYWLVLRLATMVVPAGYEAMACNVVSAVSCALAAMVLSLVARELLLLFRRPLSRMGLLVGQTAAGLTWAWADSVWGVAVETEVYGAASLMAFLLLWLALRWRRKGGGRVLALLALLTGVTSGVHWLGWLMLPAVGAVIGSRWGNRNMVVGTIVGLIVCGVLVWMVSGHYYDAAAMLDVLCVNKFHLSVGIGLSVGICLPSLLLFLVSVFAKRGDVKNVSVGLFLVSLGFMLGLVPFLRAQSGTEMAISSPCDAQTFVDYMSRRQYGTRPLLYGPVYSSRPDGIETDIRMDYDASSRLYVPRETATQYSYPDSQKVIFPRMTMVDDAALWSYRTWANPSGWPKAMPTIADNMTFFFRYQLGHMMLRYVFWNFCGRQNDQIGDGGYDGGNFISGVLALDDSRLHIVEYDARTDGRYALYGLPLIAIIVGLILLGRRGRRKMLAVVGIWALITGPCLALYVNIPPFEPRERDYIFVLLFASLCVAIGACVALAYGRIARGRGVMLRRVWATVLAMFLPVLMCAEGWGSHDRSHDNLVDALSESLLNVCPLNSVIVVGGDNDTYPLWYAQNVLGHRRDVRVVNMGLLSAPWYVGQLMRATDKNGALRMSHGEEAAAGNLGSVIVSHAQHDTLTINETAVVQKSITGNYRLLTSDNLLIDVGDTGVVVNISKAELDPQELLLFEIISENPSRKVCIMPDVISSNLGLDPYLWDLGPLRYMEKRPSGVPQSRRWQLFQGFRALPDGETYSMSRDERNQMVRLGIRRMCNDIAEEILSRSDVEGARRVLRQSMVWMPTAEYAGDRELLRTVRLLSKVGYTHLARETMVAMAQYCSLVLRRAAALQPEAPGAAQARVDEVGQLTVDLVGVLTETGNRDVAIALSDLVRSLGIE